MKAVIIDNNENAIKVIAQFLEQECPNVKNVGEATTLHKAEQLILEQKPDVVFLDIQLDDSATSFQLLETLGKGNLTFEIIFVTEHGTSDNQTRAMQFGALDFILKPANHARLKASVEKAQQRRAMGLYPQQIRLLEAAIKDFDKITIPLLEGKGQIVDIKQILKIEANKNMTKVYLYGNPKVLNSVKSLKDYGKQLREYRFFRIHNNALLNLEYVTAWDKDGSFKLKDSQSVKPSRRNFTKAKKALETLHQNPMLNFLNSFLGKA